jgi:uncharacterized protein YdaU (DUF1376 family)
LNGLPYYKAYPRDFIEATAGWPLDLKGAYRVVLDLIYLHGGRLADDPRFIAGNLGCSVRAWNGYRARLIGADKLQVIGGFLANYRADKELESLRSFQEKQRENAAKSRKSNGIDEATAKPNVSHTEPDTEEDAVAKATDASVDFAKQLWDRGVVFLARHNVPDRQARAVIGKWRKAYQDTDIFDAFAACSKQGVVDPIPWIEARLNGKGKKDGKSSRGERWLSSFVAGASIAPAVDFGEDCDPSRPLLARG